MVMASSEDIFLYLTFSEAETKILNEAQDINEVLHTIFSELSPLPFSLAIKFVGLFWKAEQVQIANADIGYGVTLRIPWFAVPTVWFWMVYAYGNSPGGLGSEHGPSGGVGGCFVGETKVTLADGELRNIADIEPGDMVLASLEEKDVTSAHPVVRKHIHKDQHLFRVALEAGAELLTTASHRFGVWGRGFVGAVDLRGRDVLRTATGSGIGVAEAGPTQETTTVFNLSVATVPTYFVTNDAILVHNVKKNQLASRGYPELLTKMASDLEFRSRVLSDARGALIDSGFEVLPEEAVLVFDPTRSNHLIVMPPFQPETFEDRKQS